MKQIIHCQNCNLYQNQLPLLDCLKKCDVMWVGLSAKKVTDVKKCIPLENNTNSGKIIEIIEKRMPELIFYKTNLVKCLPLDKNKKLRYPTKEEMDKCVFNLIKEIEIGKPKIIFVLGKKTYDFIQNYMEQNHIYIENVIYVEHPSYIYVYKRKNVDDYVNKIISICNQYLTIKN